MLFSRWLLLFCLPFAVQAASDPWIGTWRLDKAKSHSKNNDLYTDLKVVITSEGDNYRLAFSATDKDGKVQDISGTQPKKGGKIVGPRGEPGVDSTTVEVPDDHHWIYKYFKNGKLDHTRYVTLSPDGKVHEVKATRVLNGKKVIEDSYMVKAD